MKSTYVVVTHGVKPRQPTMTHLKDYMKQDANTMTDESLQIVTGTLKMRQIQEAAVILDITNEKLVKTRFGDRTYEDFYKYLLEGYPQQMAALGVDKELQA